MEDILYYKKKYAVNIDVASGGLLYLLIVFSLLLLKFDFSQLQHNVATTAI